MTLGIGPGSPDPKLNVLPTHSVSVTHSLSQHYPLTQSALPTHSVNVSPQNVRSQ